MSISLPQPLIMLIFQDVETYIPGKTGSRGVFIVGQDSGQFFFKWSQYISHDTSPKPNSNRNASLGSNRPQMEYFPQIYLTANQIQRIIITPNQKVTDMLISTLHPPEMHQFQFRQSPIESCLQFLQVLAVNTAIKDMPIISNEFWRSVTTNSANTYPSFASLARVYDISCENGKFTVPFIQVQTTFDSLPLVDELTKAKISAQYGINGSQFTNSPFALSDYRQIVGSSISFTDIRVQASRRGVSKDLRPILWPQLLNVLPFCKDTNSILQLRVKEYFSIKSQWQTLSSYQLHRRQDLRSSYQTIRMDVRRTNLPPYIDEKQIRVLMIDILKTYAVWNFDVRYTQGLNDILLPFVLVIYTSNQVNYTLEEKEALCFWCFASFVESIESALVEKTMDGVMQQDLPFVLELLKQTDEKISKWIIDCDMADMNFIVSSYMLAFRRSLSEEDLERAWDSAMASTNPYHFIGCFAAALIVFSYPTMSKIENCSTPHILPVCDKIFSQQPIGSVVGVALSIETSCNPRERRDSHFVSSRIDSEFFVPPMTSEYGIISSNHLFI